MGNTRSVQLEKYYHFGIKTFWVMVLRRASLALLLFLVAFVISAMQQELIPQSLFSLPIVGIIIQFIPFLLSTAGVLILVLSLIVSILEYGVSSIMMDNFSFHLVTGILSKEETSIPFRRIQSVEIKQPLIYRVLGVTHIVISTTTDLDQPNNQREDESDDMVIQTMDYPLALMIEKNLTDRAEIERMEVKTPE